MLSQRSPLLHTYIILQFTYHWPLLSDPILLPGLPALVVCFLHDSFYWRDSPLCFFICFIDFLISNLLSVCPLFRSVPWELRGGQFSLFEPLESNLVDSVMASTILSPLLHVETFKARRTWKCIACSERFILPAHANIISKCIFFFNPW